MALLPVEIVVTDTSPAAPVLATVAKVTVLNVLLAEITPLVSSIPLIVNEITLPVVVSVTVRTLVASMCSIVLPIAAIAESKALSAPMSVVAIDRYVVPS